MHRDNPEQQTPLAPGAGRIIPVLDEDKWSFSLRHHLTPCFVVISVGFDAGRVPNIAAVTAPCHTCTSGGGGMNKMSTELSSVPWKGYPSCLNTE